MTTTTATGTAPTTTGTATPTLDRVQRLVRADKERGLRERLTGPAAWLAAAALVAGPTWFVLR